MAVLSLVTIFVAFLLGYVVTGLVGFGGNVLILPLLSFLGYRVHDIVVVMAFVSLINATYRVLESRGAIVWRELAGLWCLTVPGAFLGVWLLKNLPEERLKLLLGAFIVALALYNLVKTHGFATPEMLRRESQGRKFLYHLLLFIGGVMQGAFVCGGPLYVIFCSHYFGYDRAKYRGMQFGTMVINSLVVFLTYLLHGDYAGAVLLECLPALAGIILAVFVSAALLPKINDRRLYVLIQLVLIASGGNLVLQSL